MAKKALKPKISPDRAQDWISSVLNPIVEGVRRELSLLPRPLRWLPETRDFEYLHRISGYVADIYLDNLEDFLEKHPAWQPEFRRHDQVLDELRSAVADGYDRLIHDALFVAALGTESLEKNLSDLDRRYFVAHIAGGYLELPQVYSNHEIYNHMAPGVRDPEQLRTLKQRRVAASRKLMEIDQAIHDRLVKLRTEIADRYGARIQPVE